MYVLKTYTIKTIVVNEYKQEKKAVKRACHQKKMINLETEHVPDFLFCNKSFKSTHNTVNILPVPRYHTTASDPSK